MTSSGNESSCKPRIHGGREAIQALNGPALWFLFCVVCGISSFAVLSPGFLTSDSISQILESRTGLYSDAHAPVVALLWGLSESFYLGKAGMLALQLGLLWLGIFLCVGAVSKNVLVRCGVASLLFLFPPVLCWAGAITKDTLMLGAAMVGAGLLLRIRHGSELSGLYAVLIGIVFFLICLLRQNGVFLVAGLATLAGSLHYVAGRRRSAPALCLALFLGPFLAANVLNKWIVDVRTYPLSSLLTFDVAGVAVRHADDDEFNERYHDISEVSLLRPGRELSELARWYTPKDWMYLAVMMTKDTAVEPPVLRVSDAQRMSALFQWWRELLREYPGDYLSHRFDVFMALLAWGGRAVADPACFSDRGEVPGIAAPVKTQIHDFLAWRLDWVVQETILFKPWLYYGISLISLVLVTVFRPTNWVTAGGLLASGLLHETALFVIAPAAEFRYSVWMMVATMLAVVVLFRRTDRHPLQA